MKKRLAVSILCGSLAVFLATPAAWAQGTAQQTKGALRNLAQQIAESGSPEPQTNVQIFPGTGQFVKAPHAKSTSTIASADGGITLNFVNADVRDVAKAVLGDYLKLNYEIGANVQGTVTITTTQPLSHEQVLPALEEALRLNSMALVYSSGIYKVVPMADAHRVSGVIAANAHSKSNSLGYGVEIVPIHYTTAAEIAKVLEPLAPQQGIVHVDEARNLLIVEGTAEERRTIIEDVALFDSNWLSGMSFALITPKYTDAEELANEMNQVLGGTDSPVSGVVRLVPIDRLNAILAISPQPRYLQQLRGWVERLDKPGQGSDRRLFVYRVQNGRAADLASTLARVFLGKGGDNPSPLSRKQNAQSSNAQTSGPTQLGSAFGQTNDTNTPTPMLQQGASENVQFSGSLEGAGHSAGTVNIAADETNNALVILATPQQYSTLENAMHELDTAPVQVFLEAAIAEITLTDDLNYGVQYFYQPDAKNQFTLSSSKSASIAPTFPGFSYMFLQGTNIKIILDALSAVTHVEVISSPELMVLNNQTASLQVGDKVPIATQQAVSTTTSDAPLVNSIEYEDTGVILKVTPRVNRGGVVMMDVSQEVSNVSTTTSSDLNSPTIEERKIVSSVAVQDGQTVALGGLIQNSKSRTTGGIPLLKDVPVVGGLFSDNDNNHTRTELMVLITPHVIDSSQKAQAITDELRRKLPSVEAILEAKP
jgi:general secretion pathway protein D